MKRALYVCPGRGSYTEASLGSLPTDHPHVTAAEAFRAERGLEPLLALDGAERFEPARHLRPANVSALIYVVSMLDAERARTEYHPVCVTGNSMGWYTALAVAGALSFSEGFRLVQEMSLLQEEGEPGGQVIYPLVDAEWRRDPAATSAIEAALASSNGEAMPSIDLGGYAVLAGSPKGVSHLLKSLPKVTLGKLSYPFKLAQHGPYHTPLATGVVARAAHVLTGLDLRAPELPLVDGRGVRWSPWSTDLDALRAYTLDTQVQTPYDFTRAVRTALREWAPERIVLPGPGNTLGGISGQILLAEGWRGLGSRDDFAALQDSDEPLLVSMAR